MFELLAILATAYTGLLIYNRNSPASTLPNMIARREDPSNSFYRQSEDKERKAFRQLLKSLGLSSSKINFYLLNYPVFKKHAREVVSTSSEVLESVRQLSSEEKERMSRHLVAVLQQALEQDKITIQERALHGVDTYRDILTTYAPEPEAPPEKKPSSEVPFFTPPKTPYGLPDLTDGFEEEGTYNKICLNDTLITLNNHYSLSDIEVILSHYYPGFNDAESFILKDVVYFRRKAKYAQIGKPASLSRRYTEIAISGHRFTLDAPMTPMEAYAYYRPLFPSLENCVPYVRDNVIRFRRQGPERSQSPR